MTPLAGLTVGGIVAMVAYVGAILGPDGAPPWTGWAMAGALTLLLPSTLLVGARRAGSAGWWPRVAAGSLALILAVGFAMALAMPDAAGAEPLWFGLPRRAAVIVYGVGLLPLLVLPWAYARDFGGRDLDAATVAEIAERCAQLQREHGIERVNAP